MDTILDLEPLRAALEDEAAVAEVVGLFVTDSANLVAALERQCGAAQYRPLAETAHSLKGAARNIGALALAEACADAERIGKETMPPADSVIAAVAAVATEFRRVVEVLTVKKVSSAA